MRFFLVSLLLLPFFLTNVYAAPAPRTLAVNNDQNLCGEYWPGDEFGMRDIPNGWRVISDEDTLLFYPTCGVLGYINLIFPLNNFNKACCNAMGYKYVEDIFDYPSPEGYDNNVISQRRINCWIIAGSVSVFVATLLVLTKRKRKRN